MIGKKFIWMFKKDILTLWRHKAQLVSMFLFPIIMITLFGYGMGGTMDNIPIVIVDQSQGELTDQTIDAFKNMSVFDVKSVTKHVNSAKEMVKNGEVNAAIILPSNYDDMSSNQPKTVVLYLDSSNEIAAQAITPATEGIFEEINNLLVAEKSVGLEVQNSAANSNQTVNQGNANNTESSSNIQSSINQAINSINLQIDKVYGDVEYIDFLTPAIIAMTVMMSCMLGMGQSIAGERETGELTRLFMTPTSIATIIGGKIFSKVIVEISKGIILILAAVLLFSIAINGNILLVLGVLCLGALTFVGFGIMFSATAQTQEDYTQMVMPFAMPLMFVSGVFYPIETMPWIFQQIAYISPLTYFGDAMRAVMIKGAGIGDIWVDIVVLLGFLVIFFGVGVKRFNRDV